jgi:hypothetical protein
MAKQMLVLVGMLFALLLLAACAPASAGAVPTEGPVPVDPKPTEGADVAQGPMPIEPEVLPLITQPEPATAVEDARLTGILEYTENGCWRVSSGGESFLIVWPHGFTATARIGAPQVLDANGEPVGTAGMEIRLGGGAREGDAAAAFEEAHPDLPSEQCPGPYWVVGEVVR